MPTPSIATVDAEHHGRVVASQLGHFSGGTAHYRVSLPPGLYLINGSQPGHQLVVVRPGETVTLNLIDACLLCVD